MRLQGDSVSGDDNKAKPREGKGTSEAALCLADLVGSTNELRTALNSFEAPAGTGSPHIVRAAWQGAQGRNIQREIAEYKRAVPAEGSPEYGTWRHGLILLGLGDRELALNQLPEAKEHLKQSVEILKKRLPAQDQIDPRFDQKEGAVLLMNAMVRYGQVLTSPDALAVNPDQKQKIRKEADVLYSDAVAQADKYKVPAHFKADLLRKQGANQTAMAMYDLQETGNKTTYNGDMRRARGVLNQAAGLVENSPIEAYKGLRASTLTDLANAHRDQAFQTGERGDQNCIDAETRYKQSIDLWENIDVKKVHPDAASQKVYSNTRDLQLINALSQYTRLLEFCNQDQAPVQQKLQEVTKRYKERNAPPKRQA